MSRTLRRAEHWQRKRLHELQARPASAVAVNEKVEPRGHVFSLGLVVRSNQGLRTRDGKYQRNPAMRHRMRQERRRERVLQRHLVGKGWEPDARTKRSVA